MSLDGSGSGVGEFSGQEQAGVWTTPRRASAAYGEPNQVSSRTRTKTKKKASPGRRMLEAGKPVDRARAKPRATLPGARHLRAHAQGRRGRRSQSRGWFPAARPQAQSGGFAQAQIRREGARVRPRIWAPTSRRVVCARADQAGPTEWCAHAQTIPGPLLGWGCFPLGEFLGGRGASERGLLERGGAACKLGATESGLLHARRPPLSFLCHPPAPYFSAGPSCIRSASRVAVTARSGAQAPRRVGASPWSAAARLGSALAG